MRNVWSESKHYFFLREKDYGITRSKKTSRDPLLQAVDVDVVSGFIPLETTYLKAFQFSSGNENLENLRNLKIVFVLDFEEKGIKVVLCFQEWKSGDVFERHTANEEGWNFLRKIFNPDLDDEEVYRIVYSKLKLLVALEMNNYVLNKLLKKFLKDGQIKPKLSRSYSRVNRDLDLGVLEIIHPVYVDKYVRYVLQMMPQFLIRSARAHVGLTFEGDEHNNDELPEALVGSVYIHKPDFKNPRNLILT